jgi:hypothetical protein
MRKGKVFVLSLVMASLIVMLLSSGVVAGSEECCNCEVTGVDCVYTPTREICENIGGSFASIDGCPDEGNCCAPGAEGSCCWCVNTPYCDRIGNGGMSVTCDFDTNEPCCDYKTEDGKCVPEASTIALLATGLICLVGYFRLRRKEE